MSPQSRLVYDGQIRGNDQRLGVCHISEIMPVVLAKIPAIRQSGVDEFPTPVLKVRVDDERPHMMRSIR
jgi:hypothetical protein